MVTSCCVPRCQNRATKNSHISFHAFPFSNPELLKKWLHSIRRKNFTPSRKSSRVCSVHFTDDDYKTGLSVCHVKGQYGTRPRIRRKLKDDAVPTVCEVSPLSLQTPSKKRRSPIQRNLFNQPFDPTSPVESQLPGPSSEPMYVDQNSNFRAVPKRKDQAAQVGRVQIKSECQNDTSHLMTELDAMVPVLNNPDIRPSEMSGSMENRDEPEVTISLTQCISEHQLNQDIPKYSSIAIPNSLNQIHVNSAPSTFDQIQRQFVSKFVQTGPELEDSEEKLRIEVLRMKHEAYKAKRDYFLAKTKLLENNFVNE